MLPQPPADIDAPPEVAPFFRIGPGLLIPGSMCIAAMAMMIAEALRWSDLFAGIPASAIIVLLFGLPLFIILFVVQGILGLMFMSRRRRAWWRTAIVVSPSALLVIVALVQIANLYPPSRRAHNELARHLGGPVPASVDNISLKFEGGMDPSWEFSFNVSPEDYEAITFYRDYHARGNQLTYFDNPGVSFHLEYNVASQRCRFLKYAY